MEKVLTVSVAAYNAQDYMRKCLDTFLEVENKDALEVFIVDDGSKDHTREIAQAYVDRCPQMFQIIAKENGGHGSTINASLERAHGRYFRLVDSDDWIDPQAMDRLLVKLASSEADMVVENYRDVYPDHELLWDICKGHVSGSFENVDVNDPFRMHSINIRMDKMRATGRKIPEHCFYADAPYFYNAARISDTVEYFSNCTYQYQLGREGQSMSDEGLYRHIEDLIKVETAMIQYYEEDKKVVSEHKRIYLYGIVESRWNLIFDLFLNFRQTEKDKMLSQFYREINQKYPDLVKTFHVSRKRRPLFWNIEHMLPVMRVAYKVWMGAKRTLGLVEQ